MMRAFLFTVLALAMFFCRVQAQPLIHAYQPDPEGHAREHNIDIKTMKLDVRFDPAKGMVMGSVSHEFVPIQKLVDSIFLDGIKLNYKEVKLDGKTVRYTASPDGIIIYPQPALQWETTHTLSISYDCTPKKGIYFIGWNDSTHRSRKQIWTQGQGIDNRHWIPGFDNTNDKLVTDVTVTMDEKYNVLGNGEKIKEKKNKDGTKTWEYRITHPHALYLTMLGIGDYAVYSTKSKSGVPLHEWYYPDQPDRREPTYRYTPEIMDFLESETGVKYPWSSYSQIPVQEFLYGAMENTTATVFGDFFYVDKRGFLDMNYVGVNAHEMAHQWFGDLITAKSQNHLWLQESFATHYSKIALRSLYGEDHYEWNMRGEQNAAIAASKTDKNPIMHTNAGRARIYPKGSFVLGMLKYVIGREEYNKAVKQYLTDHAYGTVTTYDFVDAFHDVLGRNMDWFFEQWVMRGGEPHYKVSYQDMTQNGKRGTAVEIAQVQDVNELTAYFRMPIVVEVHYKDGSTDIAKEWVDGAHYRMMIPNTNGKEIDYVLFDPAGNILKEVTFDKTPEELQAQALKAPHMIDRYDAIVAMRNMDMEKKKQTLLEVYRKERFYGIKNEILAQLAKDKDDRTAKATLINALRDDDSRVRLAALKTMDKLPNGAHAEVEKLLNDSSYHVVEQALKLLVETNPNQAGNYLDKTDKLMGLDHSLRVTWLKLAIENGRGQYRHELADMAGPSFEFRTRMNAFKAIQELNLMNGEVAHNIFLASQSANGRLARPAQETIQYFARQMQARQEMKKALENSSLTIEEKTAVEKLLAAE